MSFNNRLIEVENLTKGYDGNRIFQNISFELSPGVIAVEGVNGVGKSTLLNLLSGIEEPQSGTIKICGFYSSQQRKLSNLRRVFLPDHPAFFEHIQVTELVSLMLAVRGYCKPEQFHACVTRWSLEELLNKQWKDLSLGQKKRVFLSFSLLETIPIWLLDEPTNGLDVQWIDELKRSVKRHARSGGLVLYTCHELSFVEQTAQCRLQLVREEQSTKINLLKFYYDDEPKRFHQQ